MDGQSDIRSLKNNMNTPNEVTSMSIILEEIHVMTFRPTSLVIWMLQDGDMN